MAGGRCALASLIIALKQWSIKYSDHAPARLAFRLRATRFCPRYAPIAKSGRSACNGVATMFLLNALFTRPVTPPSPPPVQPPAAVQPSPVTPPSPPTTPASTAPSTAPASIPAPGAPVSASPVIAAPVIAAPVIAATVVAAPTAAVPNETAPVAVAPQPFAPTVLVPPPPAAAETPPPAAAPALSSAPAPATAAPASAPVGTPVTAPAVRYDFTPPEAAAPDDQARAQAIAAQKAWRMSEIVGAMRSSAPTTETRAERANPPPGDDMIGAVKVVRSGVTAQHSGSYGG